MVFATLDLAFPMQNQCCSDLDAGSSREPSCLGRLTSCRLEHSFNTGELVQAGHQAGREAAVDRPGIPALLLQTVLDGKPERLRPAAPMLLHFVQGEAVFL